MRAHPATPPAVAPQATSGGKFDSADRFLYFVAGSPDRVAGETRYDKDGEPFPLAPHPHVLVAVNEVKSTKDLAILDRLCDTRKVMLDSGIYNLAMEHARTHGVTHDIALSMAPEDIDGFDALWDRYAALTTTYADRLWGIVELDQGGVTHKPRTRQRIEDELHITPMPVYHPLLDGWDYYDTLAGGYDRICFGNLVKAAPPIRLRLLHTASERARDYPHLWTHLLGVYPNENVLALPLRGSCDSSSWLTSERWMPSWKGWAMGRMVTHYPPTMWYTTGGHRRAAALNAATASALQATIDTLATDTHRHLQPEPR
jgi:hypothetical protein